MKLEEFVKKGKFPVEAVVTFAGNSGLNVGAKVLLLSHDKEVVLAQDLSSKEFFSLPYGDLSQRRKEEAGLPQIRSLVEEPNFLALS